MTQNFDFYEKHFAPIRMKEYLLYFQGNQELAKQLYIWNNSISAAFWELISFVEVSLRNLLASSLEQRQSRLKSHQEWVFEISDLRNRTGHHHRIYNLDLVQKHENLISLATYIDPDFGIWLAGKSRVAKLLALRPQ